MTAPVRVFEYGQNVNVSEFEMQVLRELRDIQRKGEGRLEVIMHGGVCTSFFAGLWKTQDELNELQGL